MKRLPLSVALLSISLIAFQLSLMQVLSIVQWHHFASMIISVALLGMGASGAFLAVRQDALRRHGSWLTPLSIAFSGISMAVVIPIIQTEIIRFDSFLIFLGGRDLLKLLTTYCILLIPFFFGGLALGIAFTHNVRQIGLVYFANLLGSGAGALSAVALMSYFAPSRLPPLLAILTLLGAALLLPRPFRKTDLTIVASGLIIAVYVFLAPDPLVPSQFKSLSRAMDLPDARVTARRFSPLGLVEVVKSSALRFAPGLSVRYRGGIPATAAVYSNGDWFGAVPDSTFLTPAGVLNFTPANLPYRFSTSSNVLVLEANSGENVALAVANGAAAIHAVELHSNVTTLIREDFACATDSLYFRPGVVIHEIDPRSFLESDTATFDVIVLPMVGTFGGTSGLTAIHEQYLYTAEAFESAWNHLSPDGVLSISSWIDYPYRNPLKAFATVVEMLTKNGIKNPADHIAAVRSWASVTIAVKRSPILPREVRAVREFCAELLFDPLSLPGIRNDERARHHRMMDTSFFALVDGILGVHRNALYSEYDFHIAPASDDQPYFSQFLRLKSVPRLREIFGDRTVPFLELGYLLLLVALVQVSAGAFALIILPLLLTRDQGKGRWWTLVYFGSLGCGFMFLEIVLIQRFILYLGHPVYAAAAVIGGMLVFSGLGSLMSSRVAVAPRTLRAVTFVIALFILAYAGILTPLLRATISLPFPLKIALSALLVGAPSFFMGFPFPLGLRFLSEHAERQTPWAWAVNGGASVISAVLAALLAVEAGFYLVTACAAVFYGMATSATVLQGGKAFGPAGRAA
ncbi:MAG: spermidine synthase-like protein [Bacteroidota bacterium]